MNTEVRKETVLLTDIDDGFENYNELFDLVFLLLFNFLLLAFLLLVFFTPSSEKGFSCSSQESLRQES